MNIQNITIYFIHKMNISNKKYNFITTDLHNDLYHYIQ